MNWDAQDNAWYYVAMLLLALLLWSHADMRKWRRWAKDFREILDAQMGMKKGDES
jgi:hypothetical protein